VIQGTARYELRSEQFNECGDHLKELIREFGREREAAKVNFTKENLASFEQRYSKMLNPRSLTWKSTEFDRLI